MVTQIGPKSGNHGNKSPSFLPSCFVLSHIVLNMSNVNGDLQT